MTLIDDRSQGNYVPRHMAFIDQHTSYLSESLINQSHIKKRAYIFYATSMKCYFSNAFALVYISLDNWDPSAHTMKKDGFGVFHITIPANPDGTTAIAHGSKIKVY